MSFILGLFVPEVGGLGIVVTHGGFCLFPFPGVPAASVFLHRGAPVCMLL